MSIRNHAPLFLLVGLFTCWELVPYAAEPAHAPAPSADTPFDLILAVDVSGSMIARFCPVGRDNAKLENYVAPSDPEGIRWDGIHFALDIAQPNDRVALVLFSGSAAVVTEAVEDSGFVHLSKIYEMKPGVKKSGRAILKELVTELQQKEREVAKKNSKIDDPDQQDKIIDYDLQTLSGEKKKFTLLSGTSVVLTLDTIYNRSRLLQQIDTGRQGWMFLFTDGRDEDPFSYGKPGEADRAKNIYPRKTYADYLKKLEEGRQVASRLEKWVEPYVRGFREKQVPIVTFALGEHCDEELLRAVGSGTSYKTRTNLELLRLLQDVGWELREYWHVGLKARRHGEGEESFILPRLDQWRDLGLLLYYQPRASEEKKTLMQAPPADAIQKLQVGDQTAHWTPLCSRSHWYYPIDPEDSRRQGLLLNVEPEIVVRRSKDELAAVVLAFRTREPLFTFEAPAHGDKFTPFDVIPLRVGFNSESVPKGVICVE